MFPVRYRVVNFCVFMRVVLVALLESYCGKFRSRKSGMCYGIKQSPRLIRITGRYTLAYGKYDENFNRRNGFGKRFRA